MQQRKIACPYVLGHGSKFLRNAVVEFSADGTVLGIEQVTASELDTMQGVEYYNGILTAGMTNAHCHLELSYLLGTVPEGGGLVEFIRAITSIRGDFPMELQQQKAILHDRLMWAEGVQAVGDISNGTASFEAKRTSQISYHTFAEYFNMPPDDQADAYFDQKMQIIDTARKLGLAISPSPHSTYMVSDKLFRKSATSDRCSIHFMETRTELELFERRGDMYDFLLECDMKPDFLQYGGHPERVIASLPRDMPLLLIHDTNCSRSDVDKIMSYFTNVTFVICPRSNYYIERAFPPAMMLHEAGARVAMGTDSLTSNHSLSMASEIEWLARHNPELPLEIILQWATLGGAVGLGMDDQSGSLDVGKRPGAVLFEGVDFATMRPTERLSAKRLL